MNTRRKMLVAIVLVAHIVFCPEIYQTLFAASDEAHGLSWLLPEWTMSSLVPHTTSEHPRHQGTKCCWPFYLLKGDSLQICLCRLMISCFRGDTSLCTAYRGQGEGSVSFWAAFVRRPELFHAAVPDGASPPLTGHS